MAIWHTRMLDLTPYPAAAMLYKGSLPRARPLPRRWEAGWTMKLWPTGTPGCWVSLRTRRRQRCRRRSSRRLGQCLTDGEFEKVVEGGKPPKGSASASPVEGGKGRMRSEVVEGDRPGGSASASPAGKSKKMKIPKARPVPCQWEGRTMSCYPGDSQESWQGHSSRGSAIASPPEEMIGVKDGGR